MKEPTPLRTFFNIVWTISSILFLIFVVLLFGFFFSLISL